MSRWIEPEPDYTEQIDWLCEQIKDMGREMEREFDQIELTTRRVDELFPERLNHHLRLLKLEEANEQDQKGS